MEDEQGGFGDTEKVEQQHQSLFPIAATKGVPSSASVTVGTLFPSFASAPPVISIVDRAEKQQRQQQQQQQASSGLEWLANSTFSETLLYNQPAAPAPSSHPSIVTPGVELTGNESRGAKEQTTIREFASSSTAGSLSEGEDNQTDSSTERRYRKKLSKKRRKETQNDKKLEKRRRKEPLEQNFDTRKAGPLDLVTSERRSATNFRTDVNARSQKEYYFDTRGDRDSLAFGSLYRLDIAKYHRSEIKGRYGEGIRAFGPGSSLLDLGGLGDVHDVALRAGVDRYWSLKLASLDRKRKLKLLCIGRDKSERSRSSPLSEFVSLEASWLSGEKSGNLLPETEEDGETWAEYVALKTRDLNKLTRGRQHDESAWISFVNFQDELIRATNNRATIQNLVAKKIAILEKALESISDSEELLILYLETCKRSDDANTLLRKWERAVHCHSGSLRMWQEYIRFRRTQFSSFTVSALRSLYNDAVRALSAARNQLLVKGSRNTDDDFLEAEKAIVSTFVDLCRFNWQTGHQERAVGLFQAEIEFSLFAPVVQAESESTKLERFEKFWRSGARRFGEDGARGWATFVELEEEDQKIRESHNYGKSQLEEEEEPGGWTGWTTSGTEALELSGTGQALGEDEAWDMEGEEVGADDDQNLMVGEDDATLLEKLGLTFNSSKDVEVNDTGIWKRWSEKERERDREHWIPSHSQTGEYDDDSRISNDDEGNELEQMVLFDDVKESLFSLQSQQARLSLIYQFLEFFDGPLSQWCCSNSELCTSQLNSMQNPKDSMIHDLFGGNWNGDTGENALLNLVRSPPWYRESKGRIKFIQNCLGLAKSAFPRDPFLLRAMLNVEETGSIEVRNRDASRVLAKKLLKIDRKNLLLWAAYACIEGTAGNITAARTVFETTLASLGIGSEQEAPIVYLAYVELELSLANKDEERDVNAEQRALYILSHLGSGIAYVPQSHRDGSLAGTMLLRAHRGFSEQLRKVRMTDRGNLSERGAAVITCAAIFEQLMNGWDAGTAVFEEGLATTLPEKRQQSLQCELLFLRYMQMLEKSERGGGAKPYRFRSVLFRGLAQYPKNAQLINTRVRDGIQSARSWDLRRYFDDATSKHSAPTLWLFALSWEIGKREAGPRIHRLFERGLESKESQHSVLLWRSYLAYEIEVASNPDAARRVYFRAIHACPWSKALWMDGFLMLHSVLSAKELSEFVDVMRDKELRLQTDVYEILLEDEG